MLCVHYFFIKRKKLCGRPNTCGSAGKRWIVSCDEIARVIGQVSGKIIINAREMEIKERTFVSFSKHGIIILLTKNKKGELTQYP